MYNFMNDCSPNERDEERIFCKEESEGNGKHGYGTYVGMKDTEYDTGEFRPIPMMQRR